MKKLILGFLVITNFIFAQQNYTGVIDLLVANKREEARKLFDKQFSKIKSSNIDLLFLDAIIDVQNGKFYFDTYCTPQAQAKYMVESVFYNQPNLKADQKNNS